MVKPEEIPNERILISFVRTATAKAAPPCATIAGNNIGAIVSKPKLDKLSIIIGTKPQCIPNMTNTCHKPPITAPATSGLRL